MELSVKTLTILLVMGVGLMLWVLVRHYQMSRRTGKEKLGRITWAYLHNLVECLPTAESESFYESVTEHIESLSRIYPCVECRAHFEGYISVHPLPFSKNGLVRWMFDFHNAVNRRLNKPELKLIHYGPLAGSEHADLLFNCGGCIQSSDAIPLHSVSIGEHRENLPPPYQ